MDQELAAITTDRTAFEVSANRFNAYTVNGLVRPPEFPPALFYPAAQAIRNYLREAAGYWRVKLHAIPAGQLSTKRPFTDGKDVHLN
ncbi:MAG: hypothetical protein IPP88_13115 [Betaproteobacteria bacterium]|nr:hypothetical protein [Betaproteobacteria bacterium]